MSVWVEIHCDVRSEVEDPARRYGDNICHGHQNNYPMSGGVTVDDAYAYAVKIAKQRGWAKRKVLPGGRIGWVCPHCLKFPPTGETECKTPLPSNSHGVRWPPTAEPR